ncbi:LOW QUALITY PROTEIN: nicotinate phosphoribosyltransferase [Hyla sarda]|uniref:LOW QUALITY PROTEIN: nicotinate phosphoribosyltransferase n=1 Tax=Hyla sarda TaxID=327740 RepID=UPI0024C43DF3|nr:LOW QUALITY PROTEIN: nicotinate phosphoribosyltransferase [Hyla sarda]
MDLHLLTDLYQFTMAYGYWKSGRHRETAEFELFFREAPFSGGFTLFCGLEETVRFLRDFRFSDADLQYLASVLPSSVDRAFYDYLRTVDASEVTLTSFPEGSVVFPREPLMKVRGPLLVVQLLETTLLCLVNYASLVATNAARFRLAAGPDKKLLEMGLRRAQGPDGGLSAAKYSYIGGFDCTSNVLAGRRFGIPVAGTVAHSYVASFSSIDDVRHQALQPAGGHGEGHGGDFLARSQSWLQRVSLLLQIPPGSTNPGELAAFVSYAVAFPLHFLVVVDTYSVMMSGIPNFCAVALALKELGYNAVGVRLDSGDLARQSVDIRKIFQLCAERFAAPFFGTLTITVSNNISEKSLKLLMRSENEINAIGVGTHLVTCPLQPSLGCVYKLVQVNNQPRMKLSEDQEKSTIPGSKAVYRLYDRSDKPLLDLMTLEDEPPPELGKEVKVYELGRNAENECVTPIRAEFLHHTYFQHGQVMLPLPTITEVRSYAQKSLRDLAPEQRQLDDPQPYRVAVTERLHSLPLTLWRSSSRHLQ